MSPTILRKNEYRFFFFSREETRMHVHAMCADGEAKFCLEPEIELANNYRLNRNSVKEIEKIVEDHYDELKNAWERHFSG